VEEERPNEGVTSEDLYGHIDGGAEAFLELGFEQLTVQKYKDGANELAVEIYRMKDATAARGIYLARCGKETRDPALKERHTASRQQILLPAPPLLHRALQHGRRRGERPDAAEGRAGHGAEAPGRHASAGARRVAGSGARAGFRAGCRGPVSLQALYTLGDGDILQLGGRITGVGGDYKDASGSTTLIIVDYPTPAAVGAAFKHLTANLDTYLKPTASTDARLVFQTTRRSTRGDGRRQAAAGAAAPHEAARIGTGVRDSGFGPSRASGPP